MARSDTIPHRRSTPLHRPATLPLLWRMPVYLPADAVELMFR